MVEKMGRRKRLIFYVAPAEIDDPAAWLNEPGWYVYTQKPPASWLSNDPFGPYETLEELREEAESAYQDEES